MADGVPFLTVLGLALSLVVVATGESVQADPLPSLSLSLDPEAGEYTNAVRAASANALRFPRLAIDRSPASPHNGTLYVLGLTNNTCASIVIVRSFDMGRTFGDPQTAAGQCLRGPSLDVVVAEDGTLFVATWGPQVLRSSDRGETWQLLATLDNETTPASLALDPIGRLFVTWGRDGMSYPIGPVYVSASGDRGRNWTTPVDILPSGTEGSFPQIAASTAQVVVAFIANASTTPFVAAIGSGDGGGNWGDVHPMSTPFVCARSAAPSIAVSGGGIFAVSMFVNPTTVPSGCWDDWGEGTRTDVAFFRDFENVLPWHAGGPPGWPTVGYGDMVVFDDASRAFVTWHSIARNWTDARVYVASQNVTDNGFGTGSFPAILGIHGGNSTAQENLAAGPNGTVFLVWEVLNYLDPQDPQVGIYVRMVSGEAVGEVSGSSLAPPLQVELRNPATGGLQARATWTGARIELPGVRPGRYEVWVASGDNRTKAGDLPVRAFGRTAFAVIAGGGSAATDPPWALLAAIGGATVAGVSGAWFWRRRKRRT